MPWHQLNGFKMFQDELGEAAEILQNPLFTDLQDHVAIMGAHGLDLRRNHGTEAKPF